MPGKTAHTEHDRYCLRGRVRAPCAPLKLARYVIMLWFGAHNALEMRVQIHASGKTSRQCQVERIVYSNKIYVYVVQCGGISSAATHANKRRIHIHEELRGTCFLKCSLCALCVYVRGLAHYTMKIFIFNRI